MKLKTSTTNHLEDNQNSDGIKASPFIRSLSFKTNHEDVPPQTFANTKRLSNSIQKLQKVFNKLAQPNKNLALIKIREYGEYFNYELEIVESEDCTNNLEDIVTNINIEDCGFGHYAGLNHHLQKEKAFIHKEVMEYRANKSRIYNNNNISGIMGGGKVEDIGLGLENEEISRILKQSILQPNRNMSQMTTVEASYPNLPTEIMESYSNLPGAFQTKPYSLRNVSPSSTYQRNIRRTNKNYKNKPKKATGIFLAPPEHALNKLKNDMGVLSNSRMQRSLLTEMSANSSKKRRKKSSNQSSTNWNILNPEVLNSINPEGSTSTPFGKSSVFEVSRPTNQLPYMSEIHTNIQTPSNSGMSRIRKSVMSQYQRIRKIQSRGENSMLSSKHTKSQIEIGMKDLNLRQNQYAQSRLVRKSWNGKTLSRH